MNIIAGTSRAPHRKPDHDVIIAGSGFGGIGMGVRLKAQGCSNFLILEKAARPGGTWRDNHYPGAGCDIPSHLYSYSFAQNPDWSRVYSLQPEILAYIEGVVQDHQLQAHIRYSTEVQSAAWDDAAGCWELRLAGGATLTARVFIGAWGQLNRPSTPGFAGREQFQGQSFHSANWQHGIDLRGKRVATVGNGASAIQFIPQVAANAASLTVFQRSPSYVVPRLDRAYTTEERALFRQQPSRLQESRDTMYSEREARFAKVRLGSENAGETRAIAINYLHAQISDPALRAKLTPDYPIGCKRILVSDDFYAAMARPNVELVTDAIVRIEPTGIRTDAGLHEADVIIYATGFETHSFLGLQDVIGRQGCSLRETWQDGASAWLGMGIPGFPNFFMLYGPNTNLGHNSIIAMLEAQIDYICRCIRHLDQDPGAQLEVRPQTMADYDQWLQQALAGSSWSGNCTSWYKNAQGRIVNNWPGTVQEYRRMVGEAQLTTTSEAQGYACQ